MKFDFRILVLFILSFTVAAEPPTAPPPPAPNSAPDVQVYTKQSGEAVDNLNKAAEVLRDPVKALKPDHEENKAPPVADSANTGSLGITDRRQLPRDPTQMSGNFRQELNRRNFAPGTATNPNTANNQPARSIPVIELAAKIMGTNKSVMLKINDKRIVQIVEGGKISLIDNQQVITLRVDKIAKNQVKISILPHNEHLILQ